MKLQLALDMLTTSEALEILEKVSPYIDIIEIGTPLLKHEGVKIIKTINDMYPYHDIMVDTKTMDCGEYEANFAFASGGDMATVLGCADDDTIKGTIKSAKNNCGKSQVDLINVDNKVERALWVYNQNADYIGIHTGIDQQLQGQTPLQTLAQITNVIPSSYVSVAGGINLDTFEQILSYKPGIIVVGGAITGSFYPQIVAKKMRDMLIYTPESDLCLVRYWNWFVELLKHNI